MYLRNDPGGDDGETRAGCTAPDSHIVQFYEDEKFLSDRVARFVAGGFAAREPLIVIATEPHRHAFRDRLRSNGFDVDDACATGQLLFLDAEEELSKFMVGSLPDWNLFRKRVGGTIDRLTKASRSRPKRIRAYGEMVDLLWRRGQPEAAVELERLWNDLSKTRSFSLFCSYTIDNFSKDAHTDGFRRICEAHGRVFPTERYVATGDQEYRLREVAILQQRAQALETEIKRREALEAALRDALRERERSEQAAQEADRRKDEFLAMLGHELRNPLAPILTALQLMQLRGTGGDREQQVIERQVRHLARLVDDLLDVSRITRGKVVLKKEPIELAVIVAKAIEMASPLFEQRSHSLSVEVPRHGLLLEGDSVRLGQVLANLLTNAAKYTDPGGRIVVSARRERDHVVISVKDNGIGISNEMLPNVFELFVQGHRTIDRSQGGLGIGLTLARSLVELHEGTITAHSEGLGKGTEFVVRLPARTTPIVKDAPPRAHPKLEVVRSPAARILLVDDNVDAAEVLAEALRAFGHDVDVAHDGPAALKAAAECHPTTAILDIGLPVMDGYELATRLRKQQSPRPLRLLALTGYGQDSDKKKSREAGFDAHMVKPVNLGMIVDFIDEKNNVCDGPPTSVRRKVPC